VTGVRQEVVEIAATRVRTLPQPARVGVDGVTAAGKSTFADELAQLVVDNTDLVMKKRQWCSIAATRSATG